MGEEGEGGGEGVVFFAFLVLFCFHLGWGMNKKRIKE